jgi:long-chain-fatty-acid--[acyl-carrier-protein] ligase
MALFWLSISTLLAGFGLGYLKFFLLSVLGAEALTEKTWLIQEVGAIITLGPFLIFWAAAPLASAFKKRYILAAAGLVTFALLSFGAISEWIGSAWWYLFASGLVMGFFNPAKNAAIPLEAKHSGHTTESVNAILNIAFLLGLLSGIPTATYLYELNYSTGVMVLLLSFFGCGVSGLLCQLKIETSHLVPYSQAYTSFLADTKNITINYRTPLLISGLIWGLANAISLAITAYAETSQLGNTFECSLMSVYAIVGVSMGSVIAVFLTKMRQSAIIAGLSLLMFATVLIPLFCTMSTIMFGTSSTYWLLAGLVVILGCGFGLSSNLIEAEYYRAVYENRMEGTGGALLSAATAVFSSLLSLSVGAALQLHILGPQTQFICLALLVLSPLVLFLRSENARGCWHKPTAYFIRKLLSLRYKISFEGRTELPRNKGVLILPNHPAEIDPVILVTHFWKSRPIIPLMVESFFHLPGVKFLMHSIGTIPVPDMEFDAGPQKRRRIQNSLDTMCSRLKEGSAVIMYPSGRLQRNAQEVIGSASGLKTILDENPAITILLVRTRGLYGSTFSCAFSGVESPDFFKVVKSALKTLLVNFIFFIPRRKIVIECQLAGSDFPRSGTTREINSWLEKWYNHPECLKTILVPERFWSSQVRLIKVEKVQPSYSIDDVNPVLKEKIFNYLALLSDKETITPGASLREDLVLDSLLLTELLSWLEEELEVADVAITDLSTVASVVRIASTGRAANVLANEANNTNIFFSAWPKPPTNDPSLPAEDDLLSAFIASATSRFKDSALSDGRAGVLTWGQVLRAVYLLRRSFVQLESSQIGVLLPAAVATNITILGLLAAKKTPVMINWTTGTKVVNEILTNAKITTIITSRAFLDQVQIDLKNIEHTFICLEDLIAQQGFLGLMLSWLDLKLPLFKLPSYKPDDVAVILFTSGSEALPKGVPLSHNNILSNIRDSLVVVPLTKNDVLYGFLPPFHSFGLTITTFLPLVTGVRAAYHPNPSEARKLARGIKHWGVTVMSGTPTFLKQILQAATPPQLTSLRRLLAGAERTPASLYELLTEKAPNAKLLEGYGITECSPIVSVNLAHEEPVGVGRPLPSVLTRIVHPENHESLPSTQEGLILVSGPSVFNGYLETNRNPFIMYEGARWYNTGDLGYEKDGRIVISGRLKRFVKVAGEMISLQALEDTILCLSPPESQGEEFQIAVVAYEPPNGERPIIGLYSTTPLDLNVVNLFLREQGFTAIAKIHSIIVRKELPLLGSGKCDVRQLEEDFIKSLNFT